MRIRFSQLTSSRLFAAAALLLAADPSRAGDVPFEARPAIAANLFEFDAEAGDIDRDGDPDLVTSGSNGQLHWHENLTGDGTSWALHTIAPPGGGDHALFPCDLDRDGDLDLLTASSDGDRISWHENLDGGGGAWAAHTIFTSVNSAPQSVFASDIDGDGDLDALSASVNDDRVRWYENVLGDGTSWAPREIATKAFAAFSVAAGDMDGDGDADVLSASFNDDTIAWYENALGDGTVWVTRTISTTADDARSVVAADVDHDGDLDALSQSFRDSTIAWYENAAGNGTVWTTRTISTEAFGQGPVVAVDLDADGDIDVMSPAGATIHWYENVSGDGTAWTTRNVATSFLSFADVVPVDLDRDGDLDVVSPSQKHGLTWFRNETIHQTACFATPVPVSITGDPDTVVDSADFDGDGDPDVLSSSAVEGKVAWYENTAGAGWPVHTLALGLPFNSSAAGGDLDGDGDIDVLSTSDPLISWFENTAGNGGAWSQRTISKAMVGAKQGRPADLDGDGDLDGVVGSVGQGISWFENTAANGSAWTVHSLSAATMGTTGLAFADVDKDGDPDVVSASKGDAMVAWHENVLGNASLWSLRTISTGSAPRAVSVTDVDGDGDNDTIACSDQPAHLAWYENVGGPRWPIHDVVESGTEGAIAVEGADLDRDGDMDALSGRAAVEGRLAWHENLTGNGLTWALHTISTTGGQINSVHPVDLDGDGNIDALAASDKMIAWYPNKGGQFGLAASGVAPPGAMNGDLVAMLRVVATHYGRPEDGSLELSRLTVRLRDSNGIAFTSAQANAVVESLRIYRDADGNSIFDPSNDVLVVSVGKLALTDGVQTIDPADGDPEVAILTGASRTYFLVTELTADASSQFPNRFSVMHVATGPVGSSAQDRTHDIALRPACPADVSSSVIGPITPVELLDFRID